MRSRESQGIDFSNFQKTLDWKKVKSQGTDFIDKYFSGNYIGATNNSIIRGAYHFAHPSAEYFLAHGGGWTGDGITLTGAVDLEGNCSVLSASQMVALRTFLTPTIPGRRGISTWWTQCTGNTADFGSTNPLRYTTFWQYADSGPYPAGDQDLFNGDEAGLSK
ncbi:secreted hydrolase [Russula decolorans]